MSDLTQIAAIFILALTNIYTIFKLKNHAKTAITLWLSKRRNQPIKLVTFFGLDNTVKHLTTIPDKETKTVNVLGEQYQYDAKSILYDPEYQTQAIVIREGTQAIIDTTAWKPGDVDPRLFATALKVAKDRGREEAKKDFEQYKKLLYIAIILTGLTLAIGVLNYQRIGDVLNAVISIVTLIPKPVVLT